MNLFIDTHLNDIVIFLFNEEVKSTLYIASVTEPILSKIASSS